MKIVLICILLINYNYIKCSEVLGVIKGDDVEKDEALFVVGITLEDGIPFCGGTLFKENKVLTAGHCFTDHELLYPHTVYVKYGTKKTQGNENLVAVSKIDRRLDYLETEYAVISDVAVLTTKSSISEGENVSYGNLQNEPIRRGQIYSYYGWGLIDYDSKETPPKLLKGSNKCRYPSMYEFDKFICINDDLQTSCDGDSGSPLVASDNKIYGVLSKSDTECSEGMNSFTPISIYYQWIISQ